MDRGFYVGVIHSLELVNLTQNQKTCLKGHRNLHTVPKG